MIKKLYLQLFADGEGSGAEGNGSDGNGSGTQGSTEPVSFDDFLKQEGNQAEFDRRVNKAVQTAVSNAQKKWKTVTDDKVSEAEKLAQMSREEKAEYRAKQLEKELENYKRKESLAEMTKTARKMLSDENIRVSDELLNLMVSTDAEDTKKAVESFTSAFTAAVEAAVKERLKGEPPKKGSGSSAPMTKAQIMAIKDPELRQKKMLENRELFNF